MSFQTTSLECALADNTRLYVKVEDLEHEVGRLREVLRRIIGYVESARSMLEEPHG